MGKSASRTRRFEILPSERREKISGITPRPNVLQRESIDPKEQQQMIAEIAHHINNPLQVLYSEIECLEFEFQALHLRQYLKPLQHLIESLCVRIRRIMKGARIESHSLSLEQIAWQLRVMEIDVVALQTAFQIYKDQITFDTPDPDEISTVQSVFNNIKLGVFRLRRRTQEAVARLESPHPQNEFFLTSTEADVATHVALQRGGWSDPVESLSDQRVDILISIQPLSVVFENIIINAQKYGGDLRILTDIQDRFFVIRFEDDGPGFMGDPSTMFDIFVRGDHHAKSGFGVGMAICKRLVDKMNGEIWAENIHNEERRVCGARVCIRFPLVEDDFLPA